MKNNKPRQNLVGFVSLYLPALQRLCHVPTLRLLAHLNVCLVWLASGVYTFMVLRWNCRHEWKIDRENMMNRSSTRVNLVRIYKAFSHNFNHETDSNKQNKRKAHQLAKWTEPGFTLNTITYFWRGTLAGSAEFLSPTFSGHLTKICQRDW